MDCPWTRWWIFHASISSLPNKYNDICPATSEVTMRRLKWNDGEWNLKVVLLMVRDYVSVTPLSLSFIFLTIPTKKRKKEKTWSWSFRKRFCFLSPSIPFISGVRVCGERETTAVHCLHLHYYWNLKMCCFFFWLFICLFLLFSIVIKKSHSS